MPRYVIERLFDQRKEPLTPATSQRSKRLARELFPELVWEHSHVASSDANGFVRTFCIYTSPNEEMVRRHGDALGNHEILNVYEIAADVAPADIPPEGEPLGTSF